MQRSAIRRAAQTRPDSVARRLPATAHRYDGPYRSAVLRSSLRRTGGISYRRARMSRSSESTAEGASSPSRRPGFGTKTIPPPARSAEFPAPAAEMRSSPALRLHIPLGSLIELESPRREQRGGDRRINGVVLEYHLRRVPRLYVARRGAHSHPLSVRGVDVLEIAEKLLLEQLTFGIPQLGSQGRVVGLADAIAPFRITARFLHGR